jgi:hypothetical protein
MQYALAARLPGTLPVKKKETLIWVYVVLEYPMAAPPVLLKAKRKNKLKSVKKNNRLREPKVRATES